jgi:hypothetical protein
MNDRAAQPVEREPDSASADRGALLSALTTEHFVMQTAANATVSEAGMRSALYVFALSSTMVAMGFTASSREVFLPFAATALPTLFVLGVFTVLRLVDTAIENMQCLAGIARIRACYRKLGPEAAQVFAARNGRWPEARQEPSLRLGRVVANLGTTATMIAFINSFVAGAGIALLLVNAGAARAPAVGGGIAAAVLVCAAFYAFQRWRFADIDLGELTAPRAAPAPSRETDTPSPAPSRTRS